MSENMSLLTGDSQIDFQNEDTFAGKNWGIVAKLRHLHQLLTDNFDSFSLQCEAYLASGRHMFKAEEALLLRLRFLQGEASIESYQGELFKEVSAIDHKVAWCAQVLESKATVAASNLRVNSGDETYNGGVLHGFLCTPIFVMGHFYGLLCFLRCGVEGRRESFTDEDIETIELMAKGVAKMIELQRARPIARDKLSGGFVTEDIKSFEEYVQQARLPEVYGVPGRVVDVLQKRIGTSALSIDFIAEEMNLSKRTLQRRLQQQCISFAQLRDQVRFHHSINYLIEQNMSIDSISASLDFSDRTSFTNAFKRWTGLSPSTFRKLFRDYA